MAIPGSCPAKNYELMCSWLQSSCGGQGSLEIVVLARRPSHWEVTSRETDRCAPLRKKRLVCPEEGFVMVNQRR